MAQNLDELWKFVTTLITYVLAGQHVKQSSSIKFNMGELTS